MHKLILYFLTEVAFDWSPFKSLIPFFIGDKCLQVSCHCQPITRFALNISRDKNCFVKSIEFYKEFFQKEFYRNSLREIRHCKFQKQMTTPKYESTFTITDSHFNEKINISISSPAVLKMQRPDRTFPTCSVPCWNRENIRKCQYLVLAIRKDICWESFWYMFRYILEYNARETRCKLLQHIHVTKESLSVV